MAEFVTQRFFDTAAFKTAQQVNSASLSLINYIEQYKGTIHKSGDKEAIKYNLTILQQNLDKFLVTYDSIIAPKNGDYSYKYPGLNWYRQYYNKGAWVSRMMEHLNEDWTIALLTAVENDVLTSAKICLNMILRDGILGICNLNFDLIMALAVPRHPFILPGQKNEVVFFIGTYNQWADIKATVHGAKITHIGQGRVAIEKRATELGLNKLFGTIAQKIGRDSIVRNWSTEFFVAAKGCQMQLDKANVCYIGVANPVSLSIPGYPESALSLRVPGAEVKKISDGHFEIFIAHQTTKPVYAFVDATNKQGRTSAVASLKIITKHLPDPVTRLGDVAENTITLADIKNVYAVHVGQADDDFEMKYSLLSFEFSVIKNKDRKLEGPIVAQDLHNGEIKQIISSLEPGDKIYIDEVKAKDATGRMLGAHPVSYTVE